MSLPEPILYVVATPIGNLEDITLRALRVLREVDFIVCEDTRRTSKLLAHFEIKKTLLSYFAPREKERVEIVIKKLKKGNIGALVTDAGTPLISDPGTLLIARCIEEGIDIKPVPGPSAFTAAVQVSGLPKDQIHFIGFPVKKGLENFLISLSPLRGSLVFFERAERVKKLLSVAFQVLGDRRVEIHRELTKVYEEVLRGRISDFLQWEGKGEVVIILEGNYNPEATIQKVGILRFLRAIGLKKKKIIKIVKKDLTKID